MAAKLKVSSTLQLLLLLFLLQLVMAMPHTTVVGISEEEPVIMFYSTGQEQINVKNGSNLFSIPTPTDMRLAAYDSTHDELYITFRWEPESPEGKPANTTGTIYRAKLSDNKAENGMDVFANPTTQAGTDPRYGPDWLDYDSVDERLYFCDDRGVGSCGRDSGNCTIVHDFFGKASHGCRFALNSAKGTLYLEEPHPDQFPSIHKGSKDGTGEFVKIIDEANSLTVDQDSGLLFYFAIRDPTNSTKATPASPEPSANVYDIMKSDLDGKNRELVRTLEPPPTSFLQVTNDRIYWAEGKGGSYVVFSCNKFSGKDLKEHELNGLGSDGPYGFVTLLVVSPRTSYNPYSPRFTGAQEF